jgi:hypothetical protein
MEITAPEVSRIIQAVEAGELSRAEAENWAVARVEAFDRHELAFTPGTDEHRLWDALIFLAGIGLEVAPGNYLHSATDLALFKARTGF